MSKLSGRSALKGGRDRDLLCTEASLPVELILQAYLWRWEIEVAFRRGEDPLGTG